MSARAVPAPNMSTHPLQHMGPSPYGQAARWKSVGSKCTKADWNTAVHDPQTPESPRVLQCWWLDTFCWYKSSCLSVKRLHHGVILHSFRVSRIALFSFEMNGKSVVAMRRIGCTGMFFFAGNHLAEKDYGPTVQLVGLLSTHCSVGLLFVCLIHCSSVSMWVIRWNEPVCGHNIVLWAGTFISLFFICCENL